MEDFVTYDLAVKLKEKGYPQVEKNTLAMYDEDGCISYLCPTLDINRNYYIFDDYDEDDCVSPTIYQVLKWLRQEKKILVEIALSPEGYRHIIYTGLCCTNTSSASYFSFDGFYNHENNYMTYEQAALSGIEYVIDNLI